MTAAEHADQADDQAVPADPGGWSALTDAARRAMVGATYAGAVKTAGDTAKAEILRAVAACGMKTLSLDVVGDDGTEYGAVIYNKGRVSSTVTVDDPAALLDWARRNDPDRVVVVETVDPAWLARIIAYAEKTGSTASADTGGAVLPGITVTERTGDPYVSVRPTREAKDRAAAVLAGTDLLALPAGPA